MPQTNAERLLSLFKGSQLAHGTYGEPIQEVKPTGIKWGIRNSARTHHTPPTIELFERHLKGEYPLGIIPITERGTCFWGSIDIDDYSLDPLQVIQKIETGGYPLVPVSSKSGGLHLFVFLQEEQDAALVQNVLTNISSKLGLSSSEIFPKQTEILAERGDAGNWLCIPFLGTTFGGKFSEQSGIKKTGARSTLEEFLNHAENAKISYEDLMKWNSFVSLKTSPRGSPKIDEPFSDGPPCLQHLSGQGVPDGGRNSTMFMMGLYYRRSDEANWRKRMEDANRLFFNPPLGADEIVAVIRSIEKKGGDEETGYNYTCKTQPMANHCHSKLCRTRRYGIGSSEEVPRISGVCKLNTDPPLWFVNVGPMRIEATTEQLLIYQKFQALCLEKGNICYRTMRQQDWTVALGEAMQHEVTILDVSPDVGLSGQFKELMEEFLTDRQIADDKDELLRGLPWHDTESQKIYFKLSALQAFLEKQNFRAYNRSRITQRIKELGGDTQFFNVKNKGINVWFVPFTAIQYTNALPVPVIKKDPI